MKRICKYYFKYYVYIIAAIALLIGEAVCELQIPGYMSDIIRVGVASNDLEAVKEYGIQMALFSIVAACCAIAVGYFGSVSSAYIARDIRSDLFKKVISFSSEEYNKFELASLITRCTNDVAQIQNFTTMFLRLAMYVPVMGIGGVIKALEYSSGIAQIKSVIIYGIVFIMVVLCLLVVIALPKYLKMQKQIDHINKISNNELSGMLVVRAFNNEAYENEKFDKANSELTKTTTMVNRVMALMIPAMTTIMYVLGIAILIIMAKFAEDISQIANMLAFIQYVIQIIIAFTMVSLLFVNMPRSLVATKRICEVLNIQIGIKNDENSVLNENRLDGKIEFKSVSYSYDGSNSAVENITFIVEPGDDLAIVGSTGSGKSTLLKMIPRLIDPKNGDVYIDDVRVQKYDLNYLRKNIGFVTQNAFLFSDTIENNISCRDKDINDNEIKSSIEIADLNDLISSLEEGTKSHVAQTGSNVSGGQKQRMTIARAIAKQPSILLLDDSFSSLDYKTESRIRKNIREKLKGTTMICVAQRISTVKEFAKIMVLEDGKIVGYGTHKELIAKCKQYHDMAVSQLLEEDL